MSFRISPRAEQDLVAITDYIAEDDPVAAVGLIDTFERSFLALAEHPLLGPARDDIAEGLRYLPVKRYLILYRVNEEYVEIVRMIHGARRLGGL